MRAVLLFVLCAGTLSGATITVTNLDDSGPGSLREAIVQANTDAGADEIVFGTGVDFPGTISLQAVLPDITEELTITGPDTNDLFIERDSTAGDFRIFIATADLTLSHMWVVGGSDVAAPGAVAQGGGILAAANLTIRECVVTDGFARGGDAVTGDGGAAEGGGIHCSGDLRIEDAAIASCIARAGDTAELAAQAGSAFGGGIYVAGSLILLRSLVDGCDAAGGANTADTLGQGFAFGGGVYGSTSAGIVDSDVADCEATAPGTGGLNVAGGLSLTGSTTMRRSSVRACVGGGIALDGTTHLLENCTISGNSGADYGGILVSAGAATIRYCTITDNSGGLDAGGLVNAGSVQLEGTIVAANTGTSPDVSGSFTDLDNNLVGDATGSTGLTVSLLVGDSLNTIDPGLEPLAPQASFTHGHQPLWGSFAIDRGGAGAPFEDQRGANRAFGGVPDIGAIEFIANQRPAFTAGGTVTVKGDGKDRTISGWATGITAGAPCESGQQLTFEITGSRFAFESGPNIDPLTGDLHFRPREGEDGVFFFDVTLVDDGGTANGGEDTSTTRRLVIDIERTKDDDDDLRCSAAPGTGAPLILFATAIVALLRQRHRERSTRNPPI